MSDIGFSLLLIFIIHLIIVVRGCDVTAETRSLYMEALPYAAQCECVEAGVATP
jgi:hypothetical protein